MMQNPPPNPSPRSSENSSRLELVTRWLVLLMACVWVAKFTGAWDLVRERDRYRLLLIPLEAATVTTLLCELFPALGRLRSPEPIGVLTCPLVFVAIAYVSSTLVSTTSSSLTVASTALGPESMWQLPTVLIQVLAIQILVFGIYASLRGRR
jgi:hypothetical protein